MVHTCVLGSCVLGQATGFELLRVDLAAEMGPPSERAQFLSKAAEKLGVQLPDGVGVVRLFLARDGARAGRDMSMARRRTTRFGSR